MSVFAFVFPFISINISTQLPEYFLTLDDIEILNNDNVIVETENIKNNSLSFLQIISLVYIIGVALSLMRMFFNIYKIHKMKIGKKFEIIDNVKIFYTKWEPARNNDENVRSKFTVPVVFKLNAAK